MNIKKLKKVTVTLTLAAILVMHAIPAIAGPERHVAYRYVWGVKAVTEWSGVNHYTRAWLEPVGTDSGQQWGVGLTSATAYGLPNSTAHTRYGR